MDGAGQRGRNPQIPGPLINPQLPVKLQFLPCRFGRLLQVLWRREVEEKATQLTKKCSDFHVKESHSNVDQ